MQEDFMFFSQQQQEQEEEIDERIDVHDFSSQQQDQPLQSPDLLKYYYMTQLLRARNSPGNNKGFFEDWMFKEHIVNAAAAASQQKE